MEYQVLCIYKIKNILRIDELMNEGTSMTMKWHQKIT